MSKAQEWAALIERQGNERANWNGPLTFFSIERFEVEEKGSYLAIIASVTDDGKLHHRAIAARDQCEMTREEAVAYAKWLLAMFGDA